MSRPSTKQVAEVNSFQSCLLLAFVLGFSIWPLHILYRLEPPIQQQLTPSIVRVPNPNTRHRIGFGSRSLRRDQCIQRGAQSNQLIQTSRFITPSSFALFLISLLIHGHTASSQFIAVLRYIVITLFDHQSSSNTIQLFDHHLCVVSSILNLETQLSFQIRTHV